MFYKPLGWFLAIFVGMFILQILYDPILVGLFSFIPLQLTAQLSSDFTIMPLTMTQLNMISYGFLHGSFSHLLHNMFVLIITANALCWRYERIWPVGFIFLVGTYAGAALHWVFHAQSSSPLVGASAGTSALFAAVMPFLFQPGGLFHVFKKPGIQRFKVSPAPLKTLIREPLPIIVFLFWLGTQMYEALSGTALGGYKITSVAWQAHIGGFVIGLFAFYKLEKLLYK